MSLSEVDHGCTLAKSLATWIAAEDQDVENLLSLLEGHFREPIAQHLLQNAKLNVDAYAQRIDSSSPPIAISNDPVVLSYPRLIGRLECDYIIAKYQAALQPSTVRRGDDFSIHDPHFRSSSTCAIPLDSFDEMEAVVLGRLTKRIGLNRHSLSPATVNRYLPGEIFKQHLDVDVGADGRVRPPVRLSTLLIYMNDDYLGGETAFTRLGFAYTGASGDAILFYNLGDDGLPDGRVMHAGLPVTSGEKWIWVQWTEVGSGSMQQPL